MPREILRRAYDSMRRDHILTVNNILDVGRRSQLVRVADRSPMTVMNRVGQPRMALPTFVSFFASHVYRDGGLWLVWNTRMQQLVKPNTYKRERAMGYSTGTTKTPLVSKASCRQVLGQAMDLNCLSWIVSLGLAEQQRLRSDLVVSTALVSPLSTGTVERMVGGDKLHIRHTLSS